MLASFSISLQQRLAFGWFELGRLISDCSLGWWLDLRQLASGDIGGLWRPPVRWMVYLYFIQFNSNCSCWSTPWFPYG